MAQSLFARIDPAATRNSLRLRFPILKVFWRQPLDNNALLFLDCVCSDSGNPQADKGSREIMIPGTRTLDLEGETAGMTSKPNVHQRHSPRHYHHPAAGSPLGIQPRSENGPPVGRLGFPISPERPIPSRFLLGDFRQGLGEIPWQIALDCKVGSLFFMEGAQQVQAVNTPLRGRQNNWDLFYHSMGSIHAPRDKFPSVNAHARSSFTFWVKPDITWH